MTSISVEQQAKVQELLAFEAPYLEEKLLRLGIVSERECARALFAEVKKYLFISASDRNQRYPMYSSRVDEVWHQFVLFTREYADFCGRFAGGFLSHDPRESVLATPVTALEVPIDRFKTTYEACFGPLSLHWQDALHVSDHSRLIHSYRGGPLAARTHNGRAELVDESSGTTVVCRVDSRAHAALAFMACHSTFFVRELPGLKSERDRIALCRPLVELKVLSALS